MKPLKKLFPVAAWLFRLGMVLIAYIVFFEELKCLTFNGLHFFLGLVFSVSAVLLFFGGLMKKPVLTIFSSIIILILSAYKLFDLFEPTPSIAFAAFVFSAATSILFVSIGNKT